ncbi:hypothetical protein HML84_03825 [Alcanivorax sp. IO_7]|nr:hypothetical protein HML84_03825 [Alcanivorax sp. IO_7]
MRSWKPSRRASRATRPGNDTRISTGDPHGHAPSLALAGLLVVTGCATTSGPDYRPEPNPVPRDLRAYQLRLDPPLPAERVRVEVVYRATKAECPVTQAGVQLTPESRGQSLRFQVALDQFTDPRCGWQANQLWIALRAGDNYRTRFSVPPAWTSRCAGAGSIRSTAPAWPGKRTSSTTRCPATCIGW